MKKISYEKYDLALRELQRKIPDRCIEFYNISSSDRNLVNMGVNWAGIETVAPDEAAEFAAKIIAAAKTAIFITVIRLSGKSRNSPPFFWGLSPGIAPPGLMMAGQKGS